MDLDVTEEDARAAVDDGRAPVLLARLVLGGGDSYTLRQIEEHAGVPAQVLRARERALGIAAQERYGRADLDDAENLARLLEAIDEDALLRTSRDDAVLIRRLAVSHLQLVRDELITPMREEGRSDTDVALALGELAESLLRVASDLLSSAYRRVLTHLLSTEFVVLGARSGERTELAVGFVDVVGYTSLSARVDPSGLRGLVEGFEQRCHDAAAGRDRIQLVKFLGDAAMYVSRDPADLAEMLLELVDPTGDRDGDEGPGTGDGDGVREAVGLSAGVGFGEVLTRGGDHFGEPVNLAARLTDLAVGGSVVVDERLHETLSPRFHLSRLPPTKLHGIGRRRPLRVRRPERT